MLAQIGVLVATLDRQQGLLEEKTDSIKEYIEFRKLPRSLALRVKKVSDALCEGSNPMEPRWSPDGAPMEPRWSPDGAPIEPQLSPPIEGARGAPDHPDHPAPSHLLIGRWTAIVPSPGRQYYSFFYTKRSAFDEVELLAGLSPSLRAEVTRYVLRETLGQLPIFAQQVRRADGGAPRDRQALKRQQPHARKLQRDRS